MATERLPEVEAKKRNTINRRGHLENANAIYHFLLIRKLNIYLFLTYHVASTDGSTDG